MNNDFETKLDVFAQTVEKQQIERLHKDNLACQANLDKAKTKIKVGGKYAKVDIGTSGRYMVEVATGNIFGIKAYGQVHKGHFYGTLDTISEYNWGNYYPEKIVGGPLPKQKKWDTIPALTFAPKNVGENVKFRLDNNWEGEGKILRVHSNFNYDIELSKPVKEFCAGVTILVSKEEVIE